MKKVSLNPSKRQAQQKPALEKPQKPTLKPKPAIEAEKPSASPEKVELLFHFFFSWQKGKQKASIIGMSGLDNFILAWKYSL